MRNKEEQIEQEILVTLLSTFPQVHNKVLKWAINEVYIELVGKINYRDKNTKELWGNEDFAWDVKYIIFYGKN